MRGLTKILIVITLSFQCLYLSCWNVKALAVQGVPGVSSVREDSFPLSNVESSPYKDIPGPNYPLIQDSYFTDNVGNILMVVNVLGAVKKPGQIVVQENADFASIFTEAGGITENANLKKVLVSRKEPDSNGIQAYKIDLRGYFKTGDRSSFIVFKPNDTIIIPEKSGLTLETFSRYIGIMVSGATGVYYLKSL